MTSSVTETVRHQQAVTAAKTRAIAFPGVVAIVLFAAIVYIQFSLVLGQYGFLAELPLTIGFYYCWTWHVRLEAKVRKLERSK